MSENKLPNRFLPIFMIILASLYYVYEFMLRVMPSAMKDDLVLNFGISATGFGLMGSLFYWGYNVMQIPAGLMIDRYSTRVILATATGLCGIGAILFGLAPNFGIAGVGRTIIGICSSFAYIGALVLAARWFKAKYFALITGAVQFMGSMGAVIGVYPIAMVLQHYSWRTTQVSAGIFGLVLALLLWLFIRDRPQEPINKSQHSIIKNDLNEKQRLQKVLSEKQTWMIAIYAFCSWAPMTIFPAWWGIQYLTKYFGVSTYEAGQAVMFIWIGNALASPVVGWWSNRINSRCIPLIVAAILSIVTSSIMLFVQSLSWSVMCVVMALFGAAAAAQAITFGLVQDNMPPEVAGTAVGFNNTAIMMGGAIFTPLVGYLLDVFSGTTMGAQTHHYMLEHYQHALSIIPLCSLIGLLASIFFIKETNCKAQYNFKF